jgi:hypothetical protein
MRGGVAVPSRIPGDEPWSDAVKRILPRNEAQLNFVSLRSRFDCVGAESPVKGRDERPSGALDRPSRVLRRGVANFLLDCAGVVIDAGLVNASC